MIKTLRSLTPSSRWLHYLFLGLVSVAAMLAFLWFRQSVVIEQLQIEGTLSETQRDEVLNLVQQQVMKKNFADLPLRQLVQQVEAINWVDQAALRRLWPDTLVVEVQHHTPIAYWNEDSFVSASGQIFKKINVPTERLPRLYASNDQSIEMMTFYLMVNELLMPYQWRVDALNRNANGDWMVLLNNQMIIKVADQSAERRLRQLLAILHEPLKAKRGEIAQVDLRYPHGFAIAWKTKKTQG